MNDLATQYKEAKAKAINLMQEGNIKGYIAALVNVQDLHLQMINRSLMRA